MAARFGRRPSLTLGFGGGSVGSAGAVAAVALGSAPMLLGSLLLGLGWSASLIAGSALFSESLPADGRLRAEGFADVTTNVAGALAGIAAGLIVVTASFAALAILAAAVVVPYLVIAGVRAIRPHPAAPGRA